jgi:hypothetical protein
LQKPNRTLLPLTRLSSIPFTVPSGEWEKIPRLQAATFQATAFRRLSLTWSIFERNSV